MTVSGGQKRWETVHLGVATQCGPITARDGSILIATNKIVNNEIQTALQSIDTITGAVRWAVRLDTNKLIYSMCQAASGHVLVGIKESNDRAEGALCCVDPQAQTVVWRKATRNLSPIAAANGLTFIADLQGVYGIEIASGNTAWFTPMATEFSDPRLTFLNRYECLVVVQRSGIDYLCAFHIGTGKLVYNSWQSIDETAPIQNLDDVILVPQYGPVMTVTNARNGKYYFSYNPGYYLGERVVTQPCLLPSGKAISVVESYAIPRTRITEYDLLNRRELGEHILDNRNVISILASSDDTVYLHSYVNEPGSGPVYYAGKYSLTTSSFVWNTLTGFFNPAQTMCSDGQALYVVNSERLTCIE